MNNNKFSYYFKWDLLDLFEDQLTTVEKICVEYNINIYTLN